MLKILSASTIMKLEEAAKDYDIVEIGSLTVSNAHYFLCFLGELKVPEVPEAVAAKPVPKPRAKRGKTSV